MNVVLIAIDVVFLTVIGLAGHLLPLPVLPAWMLVIVFGLASLRGGRVIAYNLPGKPLRDLFGVKSLPDGSRAGNSNVSKGKGKVKYVLGELVTCPICSGTWFAGALVVTYLTLPGVGLAYAYVLAAAGIAEFSHYIAQALEWWGLKQRYEVGWYVKRNEEDDAYRRALVAHENKKFADKSEVAEWML